MLDGRGRLRSLVFLAAFSACAPEPPPAAPTKPVLSSPAVATTAPPMTKEDHAALEAELGVSVVRALDGHLPRIASLSGPHRGETHKEMSVDYASIPLLDEAESPPGASGVRLSRRMVASENCSAGYGAYLWSMPPFAQPTNLRVASRSLPIVAGVIEDEGETLFKVVALGKPTPIEWTSLDNAARTADTAPVTHVGATLDVARLLVTNSRRGVANAAAVVPGSIYAYRRCEAACNEAMTSSARVEEITLLGPPALWLGSSATTDRQGRVRSTTFSDVSVRLRAGSSATLFLAIAGDALASFRKGPPTPDDNPAGSHTSGAITFSLEIVWPIGEEPQATAFAGAFSGSAEDVSGPDTPNYPGCAPLR
jgi:hypothetical protein